MKLADNFILPTSDSGNSTDRVSLNSFKKERMAAPSHDHYAPQLTTVHPLQMLVMLFAAHAATA